ncbi:RcpC/CpaB family pilus assembly protein [Streptomyces sp. NPDC019396]|uniref:RcpC/CpaB family pilus assembly protein n=1 Tax=Streptomyces sp. NPDC019396 TaxID=3154687 RepID=UPI0033FBFF0F
MPRFAPLCVRTGWQRARLGHALRRRRRALAAGLAVTAATLAAWGPEGLGAAVAQPPHAGAATLKPAHPPPPVEVVSAPVRIADAETVRLLRPGDRVDVIAAAGSPGFGTGAPPDAAARVIATGARVLRVPRPEGAQPDGGALVVLSVPRPVASALAGAGTTSRLAVVLC